MKNGELKIEKGIPVPPRKEKTGYANVIRKLKVGDSVLIPGPSAAAYNSIHYTGGNRKTHTGRREKDGTRVWRIK